MRTRLCEKVWAIFMIISVGKPLSILGLILLKMAAISDFCYNVLHMQHLHHGGNTQVCRWKQVPLQDFLALARYAIYWTPTTLQMMQEIEFPSKCLCWTSTVIEPALYPAGFKIEGHCTQTPNGAAHIPHSLAVAGCEIWITWILVLLTTWRQLCSDEVNVGFMMRQLLWNVSQKHFDMCMITFLANYGHPI